METLRVDILIAGAGPAGTSAARSAAASGARVAVIERRAVVGVPVQCAEYIPAPLLAEAGVGRRFVVQPIRGMRTFLNGRCIQEIFSPGYTIARDVFDGALADAAKDAGASIFLSTSVLAKEGCEAIVKRKGGRLSRIEAKVIVGADGPHSRVARWIGSPNRALIPAVQVRIPLARPMDFTEIFFDAEFYGGYGWLFPKGDVANVGLGMKHRRGVDAGLRKALGRLVSLLAGQGKIKGEPSGFTAGWIPAENPKTIVRGNVLLAGDAAGHTHPMTGAGVPQAVVGGRMAGEWAARAVESEDVSLLSGYEAEWLDLYGATLDRGFQRRCLLEREWAGLEGVIERCWVTFREYYGAPRRMAGAEEGVAMGRS